MNLSFAVLQKTDVEFLLNYEKQKLLESTPDPMEREINSWNARWRKESLEHYLSLGWSFYAFDQEKEDKPFAGYFLAQPMLFLDGQTQSLWVEHLSWTSLKARDLICEFPIKLAKDKHLQKVYLPQINQVKNSTAPYKGETWLPQVLEFKTTKV